jgi:hypothetical protein
MFIEIIMCQNSVRMQDMGGLPKTAVLWRLLAPYHSRFENSDTESATTGYQNIRWW